MSILRSTGAVASAGLAMLAGICQPALARPAPSIAVAVAARDVVLGDAIAKTEWPTRLATPSAEGQFEILVRKAAAPVRAPRCASSYLVVRMPATLDESSAGKAVLAAKLRQFEALKAAYAAGGTLRFRAFAGPYGARDRAGRLVLTGCNLFFVEPRA
jgi:hypothetical protein